MSEPFHVVCSACKTVFKMQKVRPGRKGSCPSCGGDLVLPNRPLLICDTCGHTFRAKGALSLSKEVYCTKCKSPLRAAEAHESATTRKIERSQHQKPAETEAKKTDGDASREEQSGQDDANAPTIQFNNGESAPSQIDKSSDKVAQSKIPKGSQKSQPIVASQIQNESDDDEDDDSSLQLIEEEDPVSKLSEKEKRFGEYIIQSEIARGGMGIVYKAYDQKLRRTVALKVLLRGEDASNQSTMRFLREARALGALNHANIVSVYSVGEERGQFYYTMEFVDGYDLGALIAKQKTPLRVVLGYIREICLALDAAHRRGIIHRDLKPQNILIHKDNRPQIMDFGLAKDMTSTSFKSLSGSVLGTPSYMSPEQAKGETRSIDHRTDIYSMGVILYELATGSRPFGGDTVLKTIEEIVNKEPMPPITIRPNLDKDLNTIIMKCLDKNPDKRYQRMPLLAEDIRLYLAGEPINARALSPIRRIWRFARRNRTAKLAFTIIPPVILTAIIVYSIFGGDSALDIYEKDANDVNPASVTAAMLNIESLYKEDRINGEEEFARGLDIARSKLFSKNNAAAKVAIRILGDNHDVKAIDPLISVAKKQSFDIDRRSQAISAVVKIGPKTIVEVKINNIRNALIKLINDVEEKYELRIAALRGLAELSPEEADKILLDVAVKTDNPIQLRLAAISILGPRITFASPYMNDFLKLQGDEDASVVAAVEGTLARSRTRDNVFSLYGIQNRTTSAMEGIGEIHKLNEARNKEMLELLNGAKPSKPKEEPKPLLEMVRKLNSDDENIRMAAAYDLGELGDQDAISPLVVRLTDPFAGVRRSAARALLKLAPKATSKPLDTNMIIQLLHNDDALIRDNAAYLLGELECQEACPVLIAVLENESSQRAIRTMVKALSSIRGEGSLDAIRKAFDNNAGITAQTCLKAMVSFGSEAAPHLIHALDKPGEQTRAIVLELLQEISGENYGGDIERWKQWFKDN